MAAVTIVAKWDWAMEMLAVDLAALRKGVQIEETCETETWSGDRNTYTYATTCKFESAKNGGGTLTVYYAADKNLHLPRSLDIRWGHSVLHLDKGLKRGRLEWHDEEEIGKPKARWKYSGEKGEWERFSEDPREQIKRERETVERARRQARFRKRLFSFAQECAITGERENSLLDAAHVVPVSDSGHDIVANGLLLRVDLHRLFDQKLFSISPTGKIKVSKALQSDYYRTLLEGCNGLDKSTCARIKNALKAVAKKK